MRDAKQILALFDFGFETKQKSLRPGCPRFNAADSHH
jgi:hypothetical protein